jgi:PAS domain S-box-containing protein
MTLQSLPSITVLIVDDAESDRLLFKHYLHTDIERNYHCIEAETLKEGLELWRSHSPDIVLLDFQLPDGDGLEFLNDIHNDINRQDTLSHRSVIMLTGKGNENIAVNAMKLGAKDYLVKGETTALLLKKTINQVLREVALSQSLDQLCQEKYHLEAAIQARTQELAISDRKFRGIFNHSFQLTGMLDLDGNLLEVNQAALAFKGLQLDEVINRPFWETPWWDISQAARDQIRAAIAHIVQPKTDIIHYEVDLLNSDNEIICCDFSLRPLLDESGTMTMIIAEGRDLSLV